MLPPLYALGIPIFFTLEQLHRGIDNFQALLVAVTKILWTLSIYKEDLNHLTLTFPDLFFYNYDTSIGIMYYWHAIVRDCMWIRLFSCSLAQTLHH